MKIISIEAAQKTALEHHAFVKMITNPGTEMTNLKKELAGEVTLPKEIWRIDENAVIDSNIYENEIKNHPASDNPFMIMWDNAADRDNANRPTLKNMRSIIALPRDTESRIQAIAAKYYLLEKHDINIPICWLDNSDYMLKRFPPVDCEIPYTRQSIIQNSLVDPLHLKLLNKTHESYYNSLHADKRQAFLLDYFNFVFSLSHAKRNALLKETWVKYSYSEVCDANNKNLLMSAIENNLPHKLICYLLDHIKCNLEKVDKQGKNTWEYLCQSSRPFALRYLHEKVGVSLGFSDEKGNTLLHYAATAHNKAVVDYLLSKGFDINVANQNGDTPLHIALKNNNAEMCDYLLQKGANMNAQNHKGSTPYLQACKTDPALVRIFLQHGANLDSPFDKYCRSPIEMMHDSLRENLTKQYQLIDKETVGLEHAIKTMDRNKIKRFGENFGIGSAFLALAACGALMLSFVAPPAVVLGLFIGGYLTGMLGISIGGNIKNYPEGIQSFAKPAASLMGRVAKASAYVKNKFNHLQVSLMPAYQTYLGIKNKISGVLHSWFGGKSENTNAKVVAENSVGGSYQQMGTVLKAIPHSPSGSNLNEIESKKPVDFVLAEDKTKIFTKAANDDRKDHNDHNNDHAVDVKRRNRGIHKL